MMYHFLFIMSYLVRKFTTDQRVHENASKSLILFYTTNHMIIKGALEIGVDPFIPHPDIDNFFVAEITIFHEDFMTPDLFRFYESLIDIPEDLVISMVRFHTGDEWYTVYQGRQLPSYLFSITIDINLAKLLFKLGVPFNYDAIKKDYDLYMNVGSKETRKRFKDYLDYLEREKKR